MVDFIPLVSLAKSVLQALHGDFEGSRRTQENFLKQISTLSASEFADFDKKAAKQTTFECEKIVRGLINSTPNFLAQALLQDKKSTERIFPRQSPMVCSVSPEGILIGDESSPFMFRNDWKDIAMSLVTLSTRICFCRGLMHLTVGGNEKGKKDITMAVRTVVVTSGGACGRRFGGDGGAFFGGIAAGVGFDFFHTGVRYAMHSESSQHGYPEIMYKIYEKPFVGENYVDLFFRPIQDGAVGYLSKVPEKINENPLPALLESFKGKN